MANNERVIRISTEFDVSNVLTNINRIRQELGSINVDNSLFKDINKDLDKISKTALSVNASLKNGIPEKGINNFLRQIEEVNKLYTNLPDKIRQVQVTSDNIKLGPGITGKIEQIGEQIDILSEKLRKTLGQDLRTSIQNAIPQNIIGPDAIKKIADAEKGMDEFDKKLYQVQQNASKAETNLRSMATALTNATGKDADKKQRLGASLTMALDNNDITGQQATLAAQAGLAFGNSTKEAQSFNNALANFIKLTGDATQLVNTRANVEQILTNAQKEQQGITQRMIQLDGQRADELSRAVQATQGAVNAAATSSAKLGSTGSTAFREVATSAQSANSHIQRQDSLLRQLVSRVTALIGVGAAFNYIRRGVREAWQGIRELDKEFTQIAVVTDKTTSQLWQSFSTYSQMAQALGVTTKDAVATSALYYQQGLKTSEVMTLTAETIKMAQIAGMDFATATNQMTAALRGFNLEMEDASKVNDIFSTLAANAAVSTQELSYALTKTASIADSAGMSIDTTSALLTKMIETTREAPKQKIAV